MPIFFWGDIMKKKFLILTLCFTLIFSSINFKRSYADGGIISLPMLATVSALAVGTGILIKNSDDLYDIGKLFCDYIENQKDLAMATVQSAFLACTTLIGDKLSVGGEFLDIVKGFFDNTFSGDSDIEYCGAIPYYPTYSPINVKGDTLFTYNDMSISILWNTNNYKVVYRQGTDIVKQITLISSLTTDVGFVVEKGAIQTHWKKSDGTESSNRTVFSHALPLTGDFSFPYNGGYTWDNVEDKKENDKVALPIPGNLGNLVGQTSDDFWSNTDGLVGNGSLSLPTVSNPSVSVDTTVDSFVGSNVDTGVGSPSLPSLPSLPSWGGGIDFSPITEGVFTDKFPFCLAKDVKDIISVFDVPSRNLKEPIFKVPFLGEELVLDFTEFKLWFDIIKFFVLIGFIISLIVLTRGIIG